MRSIQRLHARRAFTLIELLVVIAIIAILALIAVPNFLEAQTRAKISRVKADFRSLGVAIEAYAVDWGAYPWHDDPAAGLSKQYSTVGYRIWPVTTPVAYCTSVDFKDPFIDTGTVGGYTDGFPRSQYNYRNYREFNDSYDVWVLNSLGPDRTKNKGLTVEDYARGKNTGYVCYDATNGTLSAGDMSWTGGDTRFRNN